MMAQPGPRFSVEVCDTPAKTMLGMQFRETFPPDAVMFFPRMERHVYSHFHMRNVRFSIDIAALDASFRILKMDWIEPETGLFEVPQGTQHVVEAVKGFFSRLGIREGSDLPEIKAAYDASRQKKATQPAVSEFRVLESQSTGFKRLGRCALIVDAGTDAGLAERFQAAGGILPWGDVTFLDGFLRLVQTPPWAFAVCDRDLSIAAHIIEARGDSGEIKFSSMGGRGGVAKGVVGLLAIFAKEDLRRASSNSPLFAKAWEMLQDQSEEKHWLCLLPPMPPDWIAEMEIGNAERYTELKKPR